MSIVLMPMSDERILPAATVLPAGAPTWGTGLSAAGMAPTAAAGVAFRTKAGTAVTTTVTTAVNADPTVHTAAQLRTAQTLPGSPPRGRPV